MKNINIYTTFDCIAVLDNVCYELCTHNFLQIKNAENTVVNFYPTSTKNGIAFALPLIHPNNIGNIKVYENINQIDIIISPLNIFEKQFLQNQILFINNKKYCVNIFADCLQIFTDSQIYYYPIIANNCEVFKQENYICILDTNNQTEKTLICFNTKQNEFKKFCGTKFEFSKTQIVYESKNCGSVCITTLDKENNLAEQQKDFYVAEQNTISIPNIVPFHFLNAIKHKNFEYAKTFLCETLKNSLSNTALEQYFLDFDYLNILSLTPLTYRLYQNQILKDYTFFIQNNKIVEVD